MSEAVTKELPDNWAWSTLGDVCEKPQYGWTTKASQDGDLHLLRTTDITSGQINWATVPYCVEEPEDKDKYLIKDGDIVVSRAGSVGVSYLISNPEPSVFASYLIRFKPLIDRKYVYYFLKSPAYWNAISEKSAGIALQNVNASKLKEINIPVAPPEQQKRIVAKIEDLFSHIDAGIEALKKAKQLLKQYRQSILKAAVTGELTKEWREANKDKHEPATQLLERILKERRQKWEEQQLEHFKAKGKMPKDDKWKEKYKEPEAVEMECFPIPNEWQWITLDALLNNIEAGKSFKCDERPPVEGETGIVKVSAVTWGEFDSNESKTIVDKAKTNPNYKIMEGDFLFSRANTIELVGACVIVKHIDKDLLLSDKILRFVIPNEWKQWVQLCLRTQHGRSEIESLATGNQESMRNIAQGNIKKIRIPLMPEAELTEISKIVSQKTDSIARLEIELDSQLVKADRNKQSILASAFSGRIGVEGVL
ncbi:MAG: restriction endonuclease subunit S [Gammaproteobacteria bacterium]